MVETMTLKARIGWALGMLAGAALLCLPVLAKSKGPAGPPTPATPPPAAVVAPGIVQGTVTDTGGAPLAAGTGVELQDAASGAAVRQTKTTADGSYALADVAAGDYVLHVGRPGIEAGIEVASGAPAGSLDVMMPALLVSPTAPGSPTPEPAPAMAVQGEDGVTLLAAPVLPAATSTGKPNGKTVPVASNGSGPPDKSNPGKPKPPAPPGRPPDKPVPPPFISVTVP